MQRSDDGGPLFRGAAGAHEVVVIHAWVEEGSLPALRVRLSQNLDDNLSIHHTKVVSSVEDACMVVREWLETFRRRTGTTDSAER